MHTHSKHARIPADLTPRPPLHMHGEGELWVVIGVLVLLLAAALRIATLGLNTVWWDEGFSYWIFRQPIPDLIHQAALDTHPPTYYLVAHVWRLLAGDSPLALRIPSAMWGIVTVALVVRAGRMLKGWRAAVIAGLLAAMVPLWIEWSQEIRMYAQASAFAALALLAAIKLMDTRTRHPWRWAALLALGEGGGLLSLFLVAGMIIILNAGAAVAFLLRRDRWRFILRWGAAQAAALAMFLPWYVYSSRQAAWQAAYPPIDLWFTVRLYLSIFLLGVSENIEQVWPLIALGAAILIGAAWGAGKETVGNWPRQTDGGVQAQLAVGKRQTANGKESSAISDTRYAIRDTRYAISHLPRYILLLLGVILPPLLMYVLFLLPRSERFNIAGPDGRHFLVMSAPIYLLLGWGIAAAGRRIRLVGGAAVAILVALLGWSLWARYYPSRGAIDDYATLSQALQSMVRPGDAVLLDNDYEWPVFAYHYTADYEPIPQVKVRAKGFARDMLRPVFSTHAGVWLVQTPFAAETDPDGLIPAVLEARAARVDRYSFPLADLTFYALTPERADQAAPGQTMAWPEDFRSASLSIAEGARLVGVTGPRQPVSAGTTLGIGLGWRAEPGTTGDWPLALSIVAADGSPIASTPVTLSAQSAGDFFTPVSVFIPTFGKSGPARVVLTAGPASSTLADITIRPSSAPLPPEATVPPAAQSIGARFGEHITLVAAELPDRSTWKPGETIPLALYWSTDAPLAERYKGFAHLIGPPINPRTGSPLWGQDDHEPQSGPDIFAPTILWRPGALIRDVYALTVAPNIYDGQYRLEVGLYRQLDLANLLVAGPDGAPMGGSYVLMTVTVERGK